MLISTGVSKATLWLLLPPSALLQSALLAETIQVVWCQVATSQTGKGDDSFEILSEAHVSPHRANPKT